MNEVENEIELDKEQERNAEHENELQCYEWREF